MAMACTPAKEETTEEPSTAEAFDQELLKKYSTFRLTTDVSTLTENQKKIIVILIEVGKIIDEMYWYESYPARDSLMNALSDDAAKKYVAINYGPWDRLDGEKPFLPGIRERLPGANFYPADMTKEEFEAADLRDKKSLYTFIRRDENG
jgi:hypothetical protein